MNFLFFSILTVVTASATVPVFGELITDPIETVERIDSAFAILLGGLTFVIATIGINIVANFISPAFDFSNVNPKKISWRMGGMIAAVGSVAPDAVELVQHLRRASSTPWASSARLIGPLFGVLIAGLLPGQQAEGLGGRHVRHGPRPARYWFRNGYNPNAVAATLIGGLPASSRWCCPSCWSTSAHCPRTSNVTVIGNFSWFLGCGLGFVAFCLLERRRPMIGQLDRDVELAVDGSKL